MKSYSIRAVLPEETDRMLAKYPPLLKGLLFSRGIKTEEEAERFLNPDYERHTHSPFLLKGMDKAAERITEALKNGERIAVWSDYDADGIPGGVILHDFFKKLGYKNFENYIPHRHHEGFGLNFSGIDEVAERGATLLITVDCGIADEEKVKYAKGRGLDVVITDHHEPPQSGAPSAFAVVNHKQDGCEYPEKILCGAALAFKLVQALTFKLSTLNFKLATIFPVPKGWEKWLLDMVGIATLSDMVPLTGENRVLAHFGLKVLRKSPRRGLVKLLRKLRVEQRFLTEDDVGFTLSPRINAASRMGVPMDAFALLTATDENEAEKWSEHLNKINDERKGLVASMVKEIRQTMRKKFGDEEKKHSLIVMGNPNWRPSLLGLVANTLLGSFGCPVFLWGRNGDGIIKGSCRSATVSVVNLMAGSSAGTFMEYGGHEYSGGFSVSHEKIHILEEALVCALKKMPKTEEESGESFIDGQLSVDEVNYETFSHIEKLAPFGEGNPKPLFMFKKAEVKKVEQFGREKQHLKLVLSKSNGTYVNAIKFYAKPDDFAFALQSGGPVNLVAHLERSTFGDRVEFRLRIVDIL